MSNVCIVCGGRHSEEVYAGILRCSDCGYIFADLNLDQKEFERLYTSDYFNGEEYSDYVSDENVLQKNFSARLDVLMRYVDTSRHQRLLEIGCAYGFFLKQASHKFKEVIGVDVTEEGVNYARSKFGLNAIRTDLLEWDFDGAPINVACMWDTIEHLRSPDLYLEKISDQMTSGGLLAVTTGDIDSLVAKVRGRRWRLIHPPTHAHYFSRRSLERLLNKFGFDVVHTEYCGFSRSIGNIAYNLLVLRWKVPFLYSLLARTGLLQKTFYTNFFDIVFMIARRR